jgi:hypothetical protein
LSLEKLKWRRLIMKKVKRIPIIFLIGLIITLGISIEGAAYQLAPKIPVIASIEDISKTIKVGDSYTIPANVDAKYSDGKTKSVKVSWEKKKLDTSVAGVFKFSGTVSGYKKKVNLLVTVKENEAVIQNVPDVYVKINQYLYVFYPPGMVSAVMKNGTTKEVIVNWEDNNIDTSKVGDNVIYGTVDNYGQKVKCIVTVVSYESDFTIIKSDKWDSSYILSKSAGATHSDKEFTQNDTIYFSCAFTNLGTGDSAIDPRLDVLLDDKKIDNIDDIQTTKDELSTLCDVPLVMLSPGKHTLSIRINGDEAIPELNYNNNSTDIDFDVSLSK